MSSEIFVSSNMWNLLSNFTHCQEQKCILHNIRFPLDISIICLSGFNLSFTSKCNTFLIEIIYKVIAQIDLDPQ